MKKNPVLIYLFGETHWLKPPILARHHVTICLSYLRTGGSSKEHATNKPLSTGEFGKGQKEIPCVLPPPRFILAGIHLGWAMCAPTGKTLSQKDWPKTTRKLISFIIKQETEHVAEQFSWVPLLYRSLPGCPFPIQSLALSFVSMCVSLDNSFPSVRCQKIASFQGLEGSPFLQHTRLKY